MSDPPRQPNGCAQLTYRPPWIRAFCFPPVRSLVQTVTTVDVPLGEFCQVPDRKLSAISAFKLALANALRPSGPWQDCHFHIDPSVCNSAGTWQPWAGSHSAPSTHRG